MKKFTTLKEDLIKENSQVIEKYNSYYSSCLDKLEKINSELEKLKKEQLDNSGNWEFVGSIGHVDEELEEILNFLTNK